MKTADSPSDKPFTKKTKDCRRDHRCKNASAVDQLQRWEGVKMRPRLRVFVGDDEQKQNPVNPDVAMSLDQFSAILADAIIWDRTWLTDLGDEKVKISTDLYEVLLAYSQMRPSA